VFGECKESQEMLPCISAVGVGMLWQRAVLPTFWNQSISNHGNFLGLAAASDGSMATEPTFRELFVFSSSGD
jgi:hypothetical protein